jgi:glucoamylase
MNTDSIDKTSNPAPGAPGHYSPWTSGAKTGIGRAHNTSAVISFTIGKGVLNEVYFPQMDIASIRECSFVIADDRDFFSDERTDTRQHQWTAARGIPAFSMENTHIDNSYTIKKDILSDPLRNTVLQRIRFDPSRPDLNLYVFLTPHLHNSGSDNEAWLGEYKGMPMLFASCDGLSLALACTSGWERSSVGFIGASDGFSDLKQNKKLTRQYTYAGKGNVQLCAAPIGNDFIIAVGFGHRPEEAAHQARSSLLDNFDNIWQRYVREWKDWHRSMKKRIQGRAVKAKYLRESSAALRISESRRYPGAIIASLSIPWGQSEGVNHGLGYHLVWPRDLVESAWGFLALDAEEDALRILNYLFTVQNADGQWSQNMWLDGRPCLDKLQMDQVALPLLLVHSCYQRKLIDRYAWQRYRAGFIKAVSFILHHGPGTQEDRWEQQAGLSPFTLAAEIAALAAAAELLRHFGDNGMAKHCLATADGWNAMIETWTYVKDTATARRCGVDGYYIRINPSDAPVQNVKDQLLNIHHHTQDTGNTPLGDIVSVDALALVRFGLRRADDPHILNTLAVIDHELKKDLPGGPCWRRFTKDGYGEDEAGNPFHGAGIGRSWPLLTGERAHYEIAAGNIRKAKKLFHTMEALSYNGLFPEQVWDADDIPDKGLFKGRYTNSAMPLTWAQAEYIKLAVSLRHKKVFDMPSGAVHRYCGR